MKHIKSWVLVMGIGLAVVPMAWAVPKNDPALLFIGSADCLPNCPPLYQGQLNQIGANTLDIFYQSQSGGNGLNTLVDPILLILAIPDPASTFSAPGINGAVQPGGGNIFGGTWDTGTGFAGPYENNRGGISVYDKIGLDPAGVNSANFTNMHNADLAINAIDVTNFGLYVYKLTGQDLDPGEFVTVNFSFDLPLGTFAFAYGCDGVITSSGKCDTGGNTFTTPFTQAGAVVPEPGTLLLLGSGLVGIGVFGRRFRK